MKPLYIVKDSPGKGRGVFATQSISPGTKIMKDPVSIKILKDPVSINETDVNKALRLLSSNDQARFMALHEGSRPYPSKAFRIYKANAFGSKGLGRIHLNVSLINHSCVPNAEDEPNDKDEMEVVAVKPIAKGEESFISYNPDFITMPKKHRQICTRMYYGFECALVQLAVCSPGSRRQILNVLVSNLDGLKGYDLRFFDFLGTLSPEQAEDPRVLNGITKVPLQKPLSVQQKAAYSFLEARLREAEGVSGKRLADAYSCAANHVLAQMNEIYDKQGNVIIIQMANLAISWIRKGMEVQKTVRGSDSEGYRFREKMWEDMQHGSLLTIPLRGAQMIGDAYALLVQWVPGVPNLPHVPNGGFGVKRLTKEECEKTMRRG
ncbi:hypothetical protein PRZ48_012729 [Zasmidium cellare]|uniref:SET domain-containing protein n=1 Tax=Zasmidium cellare TaxID=395010 RepID=A0ABR0E696_ZASCE|nr:hypothetical protein PRZ48_012729 [Zasmidium cellare]